MDFIQDPRTLADLTFSEAEKQQQIPRGPEDPEEILHPLREAANRVGREVEKFAEVLDGYNPKRATAQDEKHKIAVGLIEQFHNIATETVKRLREQSETNWSLLANPADISKHRST